MGAIRTFVAVLIAEDLKKSIFRVQEEAKKLASDVRWVAPGNVHITLKFLGSVDESALPRVFKAVEQAARSSPAFELSVSGLGAFPSPQKARVVWVGIDEGREQLANLALTLEDQLVKAGFAKEDKEFRAHITIGRARNRFARGLSDLISRIDAAELGKQQVSAVAVMKSDLQPGGPVYTALRTVELANRCFGTPLSPS